MSLDTSTFSVHDTSAFPVIRLLPDAMVAGFAPQWEIEMNEFLAQGRPFVIVFPPLQTEENHEDRKQRGIWLKRNKQALSGRCLCLISVELDGVKRIALKAQAAMAMKAFGIPTEVVASDAKAEALARQLLTAAGSKE